MQILKESRGKNKFHKTTPRLWNQIEGFNEANLDIFFIEVFLALNNLFSNYEFLPRKLRDRVFLKRKYVEYGYNYNFMRCKFNKAYSLRIESAIENEINEKNQNEKEKSSNYLNAIKDPSIIEDFSLRPNMKSYIKKRNSSNKIFKIMCRKEDFSIFMLGPATNPDNFNYNKYDYISINKPIKIDRYGISEKKQF